VPGAAYEYSNFGVGLLGQLLARQSGTSYEALVTTRITAELGLEDTGISLTPDPHARLARGYSGVVPIPPFAMNALKAAGDLRSTAEDLLTFPEANAPFQTDVAGRATTLVWTQSGSTAVYAKIRRPSSLALHQADGLTWLSLDGDTDPEYMIQASPDLTHWVDPSTNTIWDGPIADPRSTALAHCFYRVLEP
jgi:CubicO group peptidase (beta-lactamase class C family)